MIQLTQVDVYIFNSKIVKIVKNIQETVFDCAVSFILLYFKLIL